MTPEQFCYWLQGFAENSDDPPHEHQWDLIKNHLDQVFKKETKTKAQLLSEQLGTVTHRGFGSDDRIC